MNNIILFILVKYKQEWYFYVQTRIKWEWMMFTLHEQKWMNNLEYVNESEQYLQYMNGSK